MLKWEFEKKLYDNYREIKISSNAVKTGEIRKYDIGLQGREMFIEDQGIEGIRISFYNECTDMRQEVCHICHWADAYQILFLSLMEPKKLAFWNGVDVNELLGKTPYHFMWEVPYGIIDFDDETVKYALELVKYGFIKSLSYDTQNNRTVIKSYDAACKGGDSIDESRTALLNVLKNIDDGSLNEDKEKVHTMNWTNNVILSRKCDKDNPTCKESSCIFSICGFLEYACTNGNFCDLLSERERLREGYRQSCGSYSFTWNPEHGLKEASENRFQLAMQMAQNDIIKVERELTADNYVCIQCPEWITHYGSDDIELNMCSIAKRVDDQKNLNNFPKTYSYSKRIYTNLDSVPSKESDEFCVCFYAAYIQYLQECGLQYLIDEDRTWFHENKQVVDQKRKADFSFRLPTNLFMDWPDELFELAELLQERNYVSLSKVIQKRNNKNYFCVYTYSSISNRYADLEQLRQDVLEGKIVRDNIEERFIQVGLSFEFWKHEVRHCGLAAYVDYLQRTGQYEDYKKRRTEHKESTAVQFANIKAENPELERVLAIAKNENEDSSLYCVIEGERAVGKQDYVDKIAKVLAQEGKIDTVTPMKLTFDQLAAYVEFTNYWKDHEKTLFDRFNVRKELDKKRLYVLTEFKEFFYKAQNISEGDGSREEYLIRLLGSYQPQTYIIVQVNKKNVNDFLNLSPQIKFLFGNNVISISNWTSEKLYEVFREKLIEGLKEETKLNNDFKEKFLDYIALNQKFMPIENEELADYLAGYANTEKRLTLPPDVYQSQPAKEKLQGVIGMENIKQAVNEFEKYAIFLKRAQMNGMDLPSSSMHMLFTGGPGTGKTMIARIIADMLFELEIIPEQKFKEVEARDLIHPYIGQSGIKTGQIIEEAIGGVLFIDEAYAIGDRISAKEVIATLMKAMEDHKNDLVVIFAGYEKEMYDFLNINPGLSSRIGYTFHFKDYTVDELVRMFDTKMRRAGFEYENDEILPEVRKLCEYFKGKKNFGNGRFIDQVMRNVILAHSQSGVSNDEIRTLRAQDVPSIRDIASTDVTVSQDYEEQLDAFIGMENVKQKIREFAKFVTFQQQIENHGGQIPAGNMHMVFTGNPGTGKTTIARIMADMLFSIGIIKTNKIIEVERKDLVSEIVGQTAGKTADVIDQAMDGVLFIDEAYTLAPASKNDPGSEAIATLIKAMEDHKNDLIVIFAGYQDEMRDFINANPGINSRIGYVFEFEDYTPEELTSMLEVKMRESGFTLEKDALKKIGIVLEYFSKRRNFGNGRFVEKLMQEILMRHASRLSNFDANTDEEPRLLTDEDINASIGLVVNTDLNAEAMAIEGENAKSDKDLFIILAEDVPDITNLADVVKKPVKDDQLDSVVGLTEVKEKLREFETLVKFGMVARDHGLTMPDFNMHMIFTGNPGTGKTYIARIIVDRLYDVGLIKEHKLVEVERKDLIAGYIGQTAEKVGKVIDKAIGGILFIDEAYSLTPKYERDFGSEAIATLIKAMEDHKDDLIIIFAGYKKGMEAFVESNPGIASRIGFTFEFKDYTPEELTEIFFKKMISNGFEVRVEAKDRLNVLMGNFVKTENFGNGRFVERVIRKTLLKHAEHYNMDNVGLITAEDIPDAKEMGDVKKSQQGIIGFRSDTLNS